MPKGITRQIINGWELVCEVSWRYSEHFFLIEQRTLWKISKVLKYQNCKCQKEVLAYTIDMCAEFREYILNMMWVLLQKQTILLLVVFDHVSMENHKKYRYLNILNAKWHHKTYKSIWLQSFLKLSCMFFNMPNWFSHVGYCFYENSGGFNSERLKYTILHHLANML